MSKKNELPTQVRPVRNRGKITKQDYEALAAFRARLRLFLHFTEVGARAAGLTPQQHQLLLSVKGSAGRDWASIGELATALQISHHGAVGLVNRCASGGWTIREEDPDDRRQVRVLLTPQGEAILEELSERNRAELRQLRQALQLFDSQE